MNEIASAVVVKVDCVAEIFRRHHLGLAEFARPGPDHVVRRQIAAIDQAKCVEELRAKFVAAPAVIGEGGDGAERTIVAHVGAEVAFQRPERHDDRGRHAVLLLDAREHRGIRFDECLSALNAIRGGHAVGELQECLGEHSLPTIDIDDGWS